MSNLVLKFYIFCHFDLYSFIELKFTFNLLKIDKLDHQSFRNN